MTENELSSKYLRKIVEKRRELKITPQNMASISRMNKEYVTAIEKGEFDKLPVGYEKMFVRTYLKILKFDQDYVEECMDIFFQESEKANKVISQNPAVELNEEVIENKIDLVQLKKFLIWLPALVVLIFLFYIVYENIDTIDNPEKIEEISMESSIASLDTIDQDAVEIINEVDSLQLKIDVIRPLFFLVNIDSQIVHKVRAQSGNSYLFKAKEQFNLYASIGGNININFNDSNYGVLTSVNTRISYMIFEKNGIISRGLVPIEKKVDSLVTDTNTVQ